MENASSLSVVDLPPTETGIPRRGVDPPRAALSAGAEGLQHIPLAAPWPKLRIASAATLWRLWCRRSPVAFSIFAASVRELHPQVANLGAYHAGLFPRQSDRGLLLSRSDELVLRRLSREWVTPARIYVQASTDAPELAAWLSHTGDIYLAERLLAWSRHTGAISSSSSACTGALRR
jgi:hypothetical protein